MTAPQTNRLPAFQDNTHIQLVPSHVTPLHLKIAMHYHCSPGQWPMLHIEIHHRYADDLVAAGLLEPIQSETFNPLAGYTPTPGLAVWIKAICSVPFPVQQWVIPEGSPSHD